MLAPDNHNDIVNRYKQLGHECVAQGCVVRMPTIGDNDCLLFICQDANASGTIGSGWFKPRPRPRPTKQRELSFLLLKRPWGSFLMLNIDTVWATNTNSLTQLCVALYHRLNRPALEPDHIHDAFVALASTFGLKRVANWSMLQAKAQLNIWKQLGWNECNHRESSFLFDRVEQTFHIDNHTTLKLPEPHLIWDISCLWNCTETERYGLIEDFTMKLLKAMARCTPKDERVLAMDFFNSVWWLAPDGGVQKPYRTHWAVRPVSMADPSYFLARDFSWGVMGLLKQPHLCCFGDAMLQALADLKPKLLHSLA